MTLPNQKLAWPIAWEAVVGIARSERCDSKHGLPGSSVCNPADDLRVNTKKLSEHVAGCAEQKEAPNYPNLLLGKNRRRVGFSGELVVNSAPPSAGDILLVCNPLKVARSVIALISVYVVDVKALLVPIAKRFCDEAMDGKSFANTVDSNADLFVPAPVSKRSWQQLFGLDAIESLCFSKAHPRLGDRSLRAFNAPLVANNKAKPVVLDFSPIFHDRSLQVMRKHTTKEATV